MIVGATVSIYGIFILCGSHPFDHPLNTFAAASYLAINAILPVNMNEIVSPQKKNIRETVHFLVGPIPQHEQFTNTDISNVYSHRGQRFRIQLLYQRSFLGVCIGVGVCAILRILDHGMQIQRCPMPILIGAIFGECFGVLFGFMGMFLDVVLL